MYVAIVNEPGFLPEREPVEFDSAQDAWEYLADEYCQECEWLARHSDNGLLADFDEFAASARPGVIYALSLAFEVQLKM